MCVNRCASKISGICLSILYHSRCRKSIVGFAKEYVCDLCKMMGLIRGIIVTEVTFDNVCTHPEAYAWVHSAARRWMGEQQSPPAGMGLPVGRLADPSVFLLVVCPRMALAGSLLPVCALFRLPPQRIPQVFARPRPVVCRYLLR